LLKIKSEVAFDRTVTERSKLFSRLIRHRNLAQLQPSACHFQLIVGRGLQMLQRRAAQNRGPRRARFWLGGVEIRRASTCHRDVPMAEGQSPERSRRGAAEPGVERSRKGEA